MTRYRKFSIDVHPDVWAELERLADERHITVADVIKRAVALDKFVWEHRDAELLLKDGDTIKQVILL